MNNSNYVTQSSRLSGSFGWSRFSTVTKLVLCLGLLACGLRTAVRAQIATPPERLTYQGYLVDGTGKVLGPTNTGPKNYDVLFRIWNDPTAKDSAHLLWTEQQTVTVDNGYFSVLLGEGSSYQSEPRPAKLSSIFARADGDQRYVEFTVKGVGPTSTPDFTILPRLRLLPGPYAFLAQYAGTAGSLVGSSNMSVVNLSGTNVGINTTTPGTALQVNGVVTATSFVGGLRANDQPIYLRSGSDITSSLGWTSAFGGVGIDGPALIGNTGGILGTVSGGNKAVLAWNSGTVYLGVNTPVNASVNGGVTATSLSAGNVTATNLTTATITSSRFFVTNVIPQNSQALPRTATFVSGGGTQIFTLSANIHCDASTGLGNYNAIGYYAGVDLKIDNTIVGTASLRCSFDYANYTLPVFTSITHLAPGVHTVSISASSANTWITISSTFFNTSQVVVTELPF